LLGLGLARQGRFITERTPGCLRQPEGPEYLVEEG
jgi:hypothetical protein